MTRHADVSSRVLGAVVVLAMLAVTAGCQTGKADGSSPAEQKARLDAMHEKGADASLLVYPVLLGGESSKDVADVVGLLLEQAGLEDVDTTETVFHAPAEGDFETVCKVFGKFIAEQKLKADYALYAEYLGRRKQGVQEVRAVIVNAAGELVWLDSQKPDDPDFKRIKPRNPMTCCVLLGERVKPQFRLKGVPGGEAKRGRMARLWDQKTGLPPKSEREALDGRQQTMKKACPKASVLVYPARVGDAVDRACAENLARLLNEAGLCKATVAAESPHLEVAGSSNEQRVLWNLAKAFKTHVEGNAPQADYALYADYMVSPRNQRVHAVHFVVCQGDGEWVIVDFQNEYQADFKALQPQSRADCDRLVLRRMQGCLK